MSDNTSEDPNTDKTRRLDAAELARLSTWLDEIPSVPPSERSVWFRQINESSRLVLDAVWAALVESADFDANDSFLPPLAPNREGEPAPELKSGDRFGPYVLLDRIGAGGMGVVWRAHRHDLLRNRVVALKLPATDSGPELKAAWLAAERDILARLSHPGIGRLYDAGVSDTGLPYLAMEYVDGQTLMDHLRSGGPDVDATIELFLLIIDALEYAHSMGVAHLDLKPSNVIVTRDGRPILLDFGVARLLAGGDGDGAASTVPEATPLTPAYAAPELLCGSGKGRPADIFSLGVLLYEAVTGRQPYQPAELSRSELADRIRTTPPALPSVAALDAPGLDRSERSALSRRLRRRLDTVITRAMHPNPEERYANAGSLKNDLRRCLLPGRSPMAIPENTWGRWTSLLVGALLVVTLISATAIAVHRERIQLTERLANERMRALDNVLDLLADSVALRMQDADSEGGDDIAAIARLIDSFEARHPQAFAGAAISKLDLYRKLADIQQKKGRLSVAKGLHEMRIAELRKSIPDTANGDSPDIVIALLDALESCLLSASDSSAVEPCMKTLEEAYALLSRAPTSQSTWQALEGRAYLLDALSKAFVAPDQAALLLERAEPRLDNLAAEGYRPMLRVVEGIVAGSHRRWQESLRLLEEAARTVRTTHAWFPLMQVNMCEAHHRMAQLRLAEAACEKLHALEAHNHVAFNSSAAWTVYVLSSIHISLGEFGRAEKLLTDSIARAQKAGPDITASDFSHLYERLAHASMAYGDLAKAAVWVEHLPLPSASPLDDWSCAYLGAAMELQALRGASKASPAAGDLQRRWTGDCGDGIESVIGRAEIHAMSGRWHAALDLIAAYHKRKPATTLRTDAMAGIHELQLSIVEARSLLELGRHEESATVVAQVQSRIRETTDPDVNRLLSMDLAEIRGRLALARQNAAEALPWLLDVMRTADAVLSPNSPDRLRVLCSLATAQLRNGDGKAAQTLLREAQRIVEINQGRLADSVMNEYRALKGELLGMGTSGLAPSRPRISAPPTL